MVEKLSTVILLPYEDSRSRLVPVSEIFFRLRVVMCSTRMRNKRINSIISNHFKCSCSTTNLELRSHYSFRGLLYGHMVIWSS